jgi:hypothetical protein
MLTRRTFIKALAAFSGGLLISQDRLKTSQELLSPRMYTPQRSSTGEQYAGFLLLPDGASVPPIIKYPEHGIPIVCGVGAGRGGPKPTAVGRSFSTAADLAKEIDFPVYAINNLPRQIRPFGVNLIEHKTGEAFAASIDFQVYDEHKDTWETAMSIWSQSDFPRPFPLWSSDPVEPGGPAVVLEKVDFLPSPGIMVTTRRGYVFHWIENDVLYTLITEFDASREEALALVPSLALVE